MPEQRVFEKVKSFVDDATRKARKKIIDIIQMRGDGIPETSTVKECVTCLLEIMKQTGDLHPDDGTATAGDILSGEKAYSKDGSIIGTIQRKNAATYTPGTVDQTIAAGQYLSGNQIIKGDANLKPENIAKGKSIFGVTGTCDAQTFYECTAISGTTWSGKKLVLDADGNYSISNTVTSGLKRSGFTPEVGEIYNANTCIIVQKYFSKLIPINGLVLHVPLAEDKANAETGQTITKNGNPTYQVIDGIPCVYVNHYDNSLTINSNGVPTGNKPTTWSLWVKEVNGHLISLRSTGPIDGIDYTQGISFESEVYKGGYYSDQETWINVYENLGSKWHHIVMTRDSNAVYSMYCDGVHKKSGQLSSMGDNGGSLALGYLAYYSSWGASGYVSNIRIYNRVLNQAEITALANEFTPINA